MNSELLKYSKALFDSKVVYCEELDFYSSLASSKVYFDYFPILLFFVFSFFLTGVLLCSFFLAIQKPNTNKLSAYECGFEPYEDARNTFDVRFYLVAILFIVFDVETMFLLPWSISLSNINILGFWSMIDFIIELTIGLIYVWLVGALEWE